LAHFIDTNVVVYAYAIGPKAQRAGDLIKGATISVQVLNEFANVAVRKLRFDATELAGHIESIRGQVHSIAVIDEPTHDLARQIVYRYKLGFYDSALIASALLADCEIFYSEDLQDGLVIEDQLTVRNPFT
jgi:predicted nucleic acid-binding protein